MAEQVTVQAHLQTQAHQVAKVAVVEVAQAHHIIVQHTEQLVAAELDHAECAVIHQAQLVVDVVVTQVIHTKLDQAAMAAQAEHVVIQANHGQTDVDTVIAVVEHSAAVAAVAERHMAAAGADQVL